MFGGSRASWRGRLLATAGFVVLASVLAPPASAQDVEDETLSFQDGVDVVPDVFTFAFDDIGLGGSLALSGVDGRIRFAVPVPAGTTPNSLNAVLTVPAWLDRGWIDVESGNRPIFRVDFSGNAQTVPVSIPLGAAPVIGNTVTLDVSSTLIPDSGYCPGVSHDPVRIIDAAVDYNGIPAIPQSIAEFLPPVLRQLRVFVPAEPDPNVIGAALTLTTSVTDFYGAQNVRLLVRPDSEIREALPDGPFDRTVVLSENNDTGAELIFPVLDAPPQLYITGTGSELLDQTRLITSTLADLAVTRQAVAGAGVPPPILAPNSTTLGDIDIGTVTGAPTASIPIDQTRLGRSAADISVHLTGSYTPGAGSLTATVGDRTLAVWPADDTGRLDQWVDIPNTEVARVTALAVTVARSIEDGATCGAQAASTVTIDSGSVIESTDSSSPVPLGFGSLPQALMPRLDVALTENSFADTARAVSLVNGVQRLSTRALHLQVVSIEDALAGTDPAIVIAPDGGLPDTLELPLSAAGATTFSMTSTDPDGSQTQLTLDTAVPFGTVQVTSNQNGAALVVASSNGAPAQLDGLIGWLDADTTRWFGLTGDVLFGTPDAAPLVLSSLDLAGPDADAAQQPHTSNALVVFFIGVAGLLLFAGLLIAVIIAVRSRRTTQRRHRRGDDSTAP